MAGASRLCFILLCAYFGFEINIDKGNKKNIIILLLSCFAGLYCFSENIISGNIPFTIGMGSFEGNKGTSYLTRDMMFGLAIDYSYLFRNNITLGVQFGMGLNYYIAFKDDETAENSVNTLGINCFAAPQIGYRFGHRKLFQLRILPILLSSRSFSGDIWATFAGKRVIVSKDIESTMYDLKSGVRMDVQFGDKLNKNGFFFGFDVGWKTFVEGDNVFRNSEKFSIVLGYRTSFVF